MRFKIQKFAYKYDGLLKIKNLHILYHCITTSKVPDKIQIIKIVL